MPPCSQPHIIHIVIHTFIIHIQSDPLESDPPLTLVVTQQARLQPFPRCQGAVA